MANTKNVQLKKLIAGVLTEIFPKTLATLVAFDDGKNAAEKIAEIILLINGKTDMTAVEARIQEIVGSAPAALDTLKEIGDALNNDPDFAATMTTALAGKVDKIAGKGLSTEDFTTAFKDKLNSLSNYTLPETLPAAMITETAAKRFSSDTEKAGWNGKGRVLFGTDPGDMTEADLLLEEI